jgi:hypothetical protein
MLIANDPKINRQKRFLGDVLGVGSVSAPVPTPPVNQSAVFLGEYGPRLVATSFVGQPHKQTDVRSRI